MRRVDFQGGRAAPPPPPPPDDVEVRIKHVMVPSVYGWVRHTDVSMCWRGRWYGSRLAGHLPESVVLGLEKPRFIERRLKEEAGHDRAQKS